MCDMTHFHVRHDCSCRCRASCSHENDCSSHDYSCTWPIHICDMAHTHMRHDLFACPTWEWRHRLQFSWLFMYMAHTHMRHDSFSCATWLILMHDMRMKTSTAVVMSSHENSFSCRTWEWVMSRICMGRVTHYSCHTLTMSHLYENGPFYICMGHVTYYSCHTMRMRRTWKWVMSQKCMGHVTHYSFHTMSLIMCDMTHTYFVSYDVANS